MCVMKHTAMVQATVTPSYSSRCPFPHCIVNHIDLGRTSFYLQSSYVQVGSL